MCNVEKVDICLCFFFQAEDGTRDRDVTGVQTCALPISSARPSFRKAKMPAATIAISKNRVIAFSRTARADRLRNCFAAESGTWGPELPRSGIDFSFFCDLWCWLIEFLPCSQRARVDHREANERQALRPVVLGAGSR